MFTLLRQHRLRWLRHVHRMVDGRIPITERAFPTCLILIFKMSLTAQPLIYNCFDKGCLTEV